jgi:hypothetical protein
MNRTALAQCLWIVAAAGLGFSSAFVFGDRLGLPRAWFLVPHVLLCTGFLGSYTRWSKTDWRRLGSHRWKWGVATAFALGTFLVFNVLGQPVGTRPAGLRLVFDLVWLGVVYGAIDGLMLSVFPVVAAWRACTARGLTKTRMGRGLAIAAGLAASILVTSAYHLGYAEFRGPKLGKAIVGNTMMSIGQIATANPLAATGSHVLMHVAAVLHGADTTVQLPPHQ